MGYTEITSNKQGNQTERTFHEELAAILGGPAANRDRRPPSRAEQAKAESELPQTGGGSRTRAPKGPTR